MIINRASRLMGERRESVMDLAKSTGIAYSTAHGLYKGTVVRIDLNTLEKLCEHFGVAMDQILEYVPNEGSEPKKSA